MANYWNQRHQDALKDYYYAYTATTSATTRNHIFNDILYEPLQRMALSGLIATGVPALKSIGEPTRDNVFDNTYDYLQDLMLFYQTKLLPKLNVSKLKTFFQYAWISTKRYCITYFHVYNRTVQKDTISIESCSDYCSELHGDYNADVNICRQDQHVQILQRLDELIKQERVLNKTNTIWLLLLRQYVIDNDYNSAGFRTYCKCTLNIKDSTFSGIASRLGIRTKPFADEKYN